MQLIFKANSMMAQHYIVNQHLGEELFILFYF